MERLLVEIWSDIACPWCSIGKRRFEAALERFEESASVDVRWRSFELNPEAPRVEDLEGSYGQRLAKKYGVTLARGEELVRTMTEVAAGEGLDFRFDCIRPGNTFDAHRLLHLASGQGLADVAQERLMRAYMSEGQALGDRDVLARLAEEVGIDAGAVRALFDGDAFEREVRADEEEARARGISGVPYFLVGGRHGLSGAQPVEVLLQALQRSWSEAGGAGADGEAGGSGAVPGDV